MPLTHVSFGNNPPDDNKTKDEQRKSDDASDGSHRYNLSGALFSSTRNVLGKILTQLGLPAATEFSQTTAETFEDLNDEWVTDQGRLQISVLLQLVLVEEISQETGLSEQDAIDLLELQPCLDAIDNG